MDLVLVDVLPPLQKAFSALIGLELRSEMAGASLRKAWSPVLKGMELCSPFITEEDF